MAWYNPTDPTQRYWMLGGLLALGLIVPFRMYLLAPRQTANAEVLERVENLQEGNRVAEVIAARGGGDLEERLDLYRRHVAKLQELIPRQDQVPALLNDIQAEARLVNVQVQSLDPETPDSVDVYEKHSYSMQVIGEYHAVARFLTQIASLSRIVTPVEVGLEVAPQAQLYPELEFPVLATFRIETYVLRDVSALPNSTEGAENEG